MGIRNAFRERFLDVLGSIYIYNEHRGYTSLDRVLEAVRARCPDDADFIAAVEKHRADEEKHYRMFRRWFELQGKMPLKVDRTCGHIDHFIETIFGCTIDELDTQAIVADGDEFEKLCRVIMITEQRGMEQVEVLLRNRHIRSDKALRRIFEVVERDETSHWMPYDSWLRAHGRRPKPRWREKWTDYWIHKSLMLVKLPAVFLDRKNPRLAGWPDENPQVYAI
ncbi:ferritin-like domain-containing protein [Erythrobacter sp.]|uniref:ferritin-like domain-containing protein n=1 Tax=Erythrobacter sp. TaxID=1042 RepID=UPI001B232363|nr:ferritin-like domain-containing protein [Erythrobacter sp.]MBO6527991.1 ferritin-like domain-containing protein [Erythrobacter sp.]MBO6530373.1 ferritin-like domain-containing protein [Erythrobacter sp.]